MTKTGYIIIGVIAVVGMMLLYCYLSVQNVENQPGSTQIPKEAPGADTQVANPASVYCVESMNGVLDIVDTNEGQIGMCTLPDGRQCEEWELYRTGSCPTPQVREQTPHKTVRGETIDLSGQGLTEVPGSTFNNTNTEILDLSSNNLSGALQAEIRFMQKLRVLNLSDNNFTGVPAEVGQLANLEVLNLANNPITGLPYEIGNLKNLQILDLRGTNYAQQDLDVIQQGLPAAVEIKTDDN